MRTRALRILAAAFLGILVLSGCTEVTEAKHKAVEPYTKMETSAGLYRVTLTEDAIKRLDVRTHPVTQERSRTGVVRKVIPYEGLIYDLDGATWTYTSPEAGHFIRQAIRVDYIERGLVYLLDGPEVGTHVVVTGAAELYGIEFGLGK